MERRAARRITRILSAAEQQRLHLEREQIALELPGLTAQDQMRKEAREEPTLSGELRRRIHASTHSLSHLAAQASLPPIALDEFLTGERTLRSDAMDRLAKALGYEWIAAKAS
jgi:hypothetical protein